MESYWSQGDITVNNSSLHYYRTGNVKNQPILLIHGFSDNGLCWTPTARELEGKYDVIMTDLQSHGLSSHINQEQIFDMASDLKEVILSLKLVQPILIGHSMGAMLAYRVGIRYPDMIKAIILEDPPWMSIDRGVDEGTKDGMVQWARGLTSKTIEDLELIYKKGHSTWSDEFIHIMSKSKKQFDPTSVKLLVDGRHLNNHDWIKSISNICFPLLIITGNPDLGGIVTKEVVNQIHERNPKVQLENVPDVGHLIRFDNFKEFMRILSTFLDSI